MDKSKSENKKGFLSKIPDNIKVGFFRWWLVGAIYFFIAWGTNLGLNSDAFDLVFILGLAISIAHVFIFNPIVYGMFEIERNGKIVNKKYNERTVLEGVLLKLFEFLKCMVCSVLVFIAYLLINKAIISLFHLSEDAMPVKGEPIIYATIFVLFYSFFTFINNKILLLVERRKLKKNNE